MLDYGPKRSFTFSRQKRGGYGDIQGKAPKPPGPSGISGSKASEDPRAEAHVPDERNDGHIVKNAARAKRRAASCECRRHVSFAPFSARPAKIRKVNGRILSWRRGSALAESITEIRGMEIRRKAGAGFCPTNDMGERKVLGEGELHCREGIVGNAVFYSRTGNDTLQFRYAQV